MSEFFTRLQYVLGKFLDAVVGATGSVDLASLEQFSARYEYTIAAVSAFATLAAVILALWLARRLTRRRALVAVTIAGDEDEAGPIRDRNIGMRISNVGYAPIFVGHRGFSSCLPFGPFRRESVRGVAVAPRDVGLSAMQNLEIPPGRSHVVLLRKVGDFISAKDGTFSLWRKRRARFRVELQTGERFTTGFSRYEIAQLRDAVREEQRPDPGFSEAEIHDVEDFDPHTEEFEASSGPAQTAMRQ